MDNTQSGGESSHHVQRPWRAILPLMFGAFWGCSVKLC